MIKITIEKNGAVNPLRFVLGNQYENNDETLAFDFPVELNECYKYLIATHKETGKTIVLPINEAQISVSSALTWLAGEWLMQVLFKGTELDLEATELDLKDDVVSISNQFYGFVKKASFKVENLKEAPVDKNIKVYYESMKQSIIDEVVAQIGTGGGTGGVSDVLVNGTSIVDENDNANIPIASANNLGVISNGNSTYINGGKLHVLLASDSHIDNRNVGPVLLVSKLDYAIKQAMTDGKGAEWSAEEKSRARARMGFDLEPVVIDIETTEEVKMIEIAIHDGKPLSDYDFKQMWVYVKSAGGGNSANSEVQFKINGTKPEDLPYLSCPTGVINNTNVVHWGGYLDIRNGLALSNTTISLAPHYRVDAQMTQSSYKLLFIDNINKVTIQSISTVMPIGTKFTVVLR